MIKYAGDLWKGNRLIFPHPLSPCFHGFIMLWKKVFTAYFILCQILLIDKTKTVNYHKGRSEVIMEIGAQIKKYRAKFNLSQEELAEKLYVTRQTISNWETGKSYPDIHSALLRSSVFQTSLDQLIKGDLELMKEEIRKEDIKTFKIYGNIYTVLLAVCVLSFAPLVYYFYLWGMAVSLVLFIITFMVALKVEKFKKQTDVQTYKEFLAFMNGQRLDEISKKQEEAKRPYQKILLAIASGFITLVILSLSFAILKFIN